MTDHPIIAEIDKFLAASGMSPTAFGLAVARDATLVPDLRGGRDIRYSTERKIREWMAAHPPERTIAS